MNQLKTKGYGVNRSFLDDLSLITFERNAPGENEVLIDILYCGVCHSDLHQIKNDWGNTVYPCIPGHEIIGKVMSIGIGVKKFQIGDTVGVGCMVDSCGNCDSCQEGLEQYCEGPVGATLTYNGPMKPDGSNTYGGYSEQIVVKESFVLRIPDNLTISAAAPILCAGVTTYSPLKHWKIKQGDKVGVIGIGGLGHMAVQLANAMGAEVTAITTSKSKESDARKLGAKHVIVSEDEKILKEEELSLDFILDTIPDEHDINIFTKMLKRDGTLVVVGALGPFKKPTNNQEIAFHRRSVAGSTIGGIQETQEVLDFCAANAILPEVEIIPIQDINKAFQRMKKEDIKFRFVIDMKTLKNESDK